MNVPASIYYQSHEMQFKVSKIIMEEYSKWIKWRYDGEDTLIDIGCGCGDVTVDVISAGIPKNFKLLVGVDIAEDMIELARSMYETPRIRFEKLNIEGSIKSILQKYPDRFDHATSFYTLHWIQDLRLAISNVYDLLKDDGDCLLMILARHTFFDINKKLSKSSKWSNYCVENNDRFTSPYQNFESPLQDFDSLFDVAGFRVRNIREVNEEYSYNGVDCFKRNLFAVHPFIRNLAFDKQSEYFDDFLKHLLDEGLVRQNEANDDFIITVRYKVLIAYCSKLKSMC